MVPGDSFESSNGRGSLDHLANEPYYITPELYLGNELEAYLVYNAKVVSE